MTHVICVANNKGGVGKSTISMNLGGALSEMGKRTLLVDLDPQADLTSVFLDPTQIHSQTVADLLYNDEEIEGIILAAKIGNVSILPASSKLQDIDSRLAGDDDAQFFLSEELERVRDDYDFVIIDCPPSLGKATRMALVAADYAIIPIQCQDWAVKGCQKLIATIESVQKRVNPKLKMLGIVINRFNSRRRMENLYLESLYKTFNNKMFQTVFRDNVPYMEAVTAKLPITHYQSNSLHADAYRKFAQEVIDRVK